VQDGGAEDEANAVIEGSEAGGGVVEAAVEGLIAEAVGKGAAVEANAYATLVGRCLDGLSTFEIDFRGLTASPSCIMVRGYPLETTLGTIRSRLRDGFGSSTLHHTMESRYPARTAHATNDWYHHHAEVHRIARFALQPQSLPG